MRLLFAISDTQRTSATGTTLARPRLRSTSSSCSTTKRSTSSRMSKSSSQSSRCVVACPTIQCQMHNALMHNAKCTMPNAQCQMHNAQCTMPNAHAQCQMLIIGLFLSFVSCRLVLWSWTNPSRFSTRHRTTVQRWRFWRFCSKWRTRVSFSFPCSLKFARLVSAASEPGIAASTCHMQTLKCTSAQMRK